MGVTRRPPTYAGAVLHHTDQKGPNILTGSVLYMKVTAWWTILGWTQKLTVNRNVELLSH